MSNATKYVEACLRYARRHRGQTGSNPSVGTLLVKDGVVVGRGITARGGRPHAEPIAIAQAGNKAIGSTAYVTLEPCAHHGATPPCAQALIDAGVTRVVTAWIDPDNRVDGKGHAMLRQAGIEVETGQGSEIASHDLSGYLNRKQKNRPQVVLKIAVSTDGKMGRVDEEVSVTGALAKNYAHRMRAEYDAILIGRGTVDADDPELTCRLSGLVGRSPQRFILDTNASLSAESNLAKTASEIPTFVVTSAPQLSEELTTLGVKPLAAESSAGELALPEIIEDMAATGISSLMVEGGAQVARSFLEANLIDDIALFTSTKAIGDGIVSPVTRDTVPDNFKLVRSLQLGDDTLDLFTRK